MERLSLIDIAVEDDLLSSSPSDALIDQISPGLSEMHATNKCIQSIPADSDEGLIKLKMSKQMEKVLELSESPEQNQTKPGKYNLRKSLAWDSAFFTSEGVLNHEELAIVNSTFKKTEAHKLPIIQEDTRKSSESTSTLDNDSWVLENLEVDLFDNIRASIQKTHGNGEEASRLANFSKKSNTCDDVSINVEPSPHNKKKTPGVVSNHNDRHASRVANNAKLVTDGIASSKIISKPPRVLPKLVPPTMPAKAPAVPGNTKTRTVRDRPGNAASQKSVMVSKKINAGSCGITSKSSQSPKTNVNLVNIRAEKVRTSPREITRMRSNRAIDRSSSGPITNKVSLRTSGTKIVSRSRNSSGLSPKSVVSSSSNVSPSSSFDSVASASSSSTIFGLKPSADCTEASSSSPSLGGVDNDKLHSPVLRSLHSRDPIISSPDSCLPFEPSKGYHLDIRTNSSSGANCYKPSGLKMPTPKIGYFDGTKPVTCNVNTHQTCQQPNILKFTAGVSKTESVSKLKLSQLQYTAPTVQNMTMTSDLPKTQSTPHPCTPTKAQLRAIEKDFYSKNFEEVENSNLESRRVPKLCTKMEERNLHTENIPMEGEEAILNDRSSTINKLSQMVSRMGVQETGSQKSTHCDLSNFNAEKENTNIAAE